ncbi:tail assembly chaperone [Gordonia Phage Jablanski]|nr:tail assembly chaperone [Gordonia Phage Jablanski]
MKITITPAHDPDLMCDFEIPRKNGKAIEFSVIRMEYTPPDKNAEFDAWLQDELKPRPVLDDDGKPVLNEFGNPSFERKTVTDREVTLKMLELCGVAKTTLTQLSKLTNGEILEIWKRWGDASKVNQGEIRRLRELLEGEHGGALWVDLWTRGFKPDHAGTVGYSWYDLKTLFEWLPNDGNSALFRSLNPETWQWANLDTRLLAEIATIGSDHRFLTAASLMEEVPNDYWRTKYGPKTTDDAADVERAAEAESASAKAQQVADEIRAEMALAG